MQIVQSDLEIETIFNRIVRGDIDLQPDFQRGDVWSRPKKRKLIDTVLRGWSMPPIHMIEDSNSAIWSVLDGQQRLTSICDFMNGIFSIDGNISPKEDRVVNLDGKYFVDLDQDWRRRVIGYEVRIIRIKNASPEEAAELFYRLNEPLSLTAAEQRNVFFGKPRDQVKGLVNKLASLTGGKEKLGFSNSRLAYDDIISRLCVYVESGSFWENADSKSLAEIYRTKEGFSDHTVEIVELTIEKFSDAIGAFSRGVKFTKSSLLSWLYFSSNLIEKGSIWNNNDLGILIVGFERLRAGAKMDEGELKEDDIEGLLLNLYNERLTSQTMDASSIGERDMILWLYAFMNSDVNKFRELYSEYYDYFIDLYSIAQSNSEISFLRRFNAFEWSNIR